MGLLEALLGKENPAAQWAGKNQNWLGTVGTGIANGLEFGNLGEARQMDYLGEQQKVAEAKVTAQTNATLNYFRQKYPDIAQKVEAGLPMGEAWNEAMRRETPQAKRAPIEINGQLVDPDTYEVLGDFRTQEGTAMPTPPSGYRWTPEGNMEAVPGGPAYTDPTAIDPKAAAAAGRRDVATQTVTTAAATARELAKNQFNVGLAGAAAGFNPQSDAAELRRQVDVLRSTASIENLTAMRQASPTGGALGAVSDRDNAMLAAASGAIDPNAGPDAFNRALDNYELTLLQIVHGPDAGRQIFDETRENGYAAGGGLNQSSGVNYVFNPATGRLEPQ